MRIQKKRILNLERNLPGVPHGVEVVLVAPIDDITSQRLQRVGFSASPRVGEKILPSRLGPISRFNAEGSFIRHRNQPKETCYKQREWRYQQWHGKNRIEVVEFVDVPYHRYPRTLVPPPGIELSVVVLPDGRLAIATEESFLFAPTKPRKLRHGINLMLELFGFCDVVTKDLLPTGVVPTISLNWKLLPPGEMPWSKLEPHLHRVLNVRRKGARPVIEHRLKEINSYKPAFVAVGHGGFTGYVIFGFPEAGIYVLECAHYENATYVFESEWKELSKLTKAEILAQERHKARLVHQSHWETRIRSLFKSAEAA
ncbi:hypothetical protein BST81_23770 [Leptolyngbya sp. 'hensonii']|nr:hypothetical protein BST81_23770 [Leptolyngbya sp. 'hensonii']